METLEKAWIFLAVVYGSLFVLIGFFSQFSKLLIKHSKQAERMLGEPKFYKKTKSWVENKLKISTTSGAFLILILNITNIIFIMILIYELQVEPNETTIKTLFAFALFFLFVYLLKFYCADKKFQYFVSASAIFDYLSFMPPIISFIENKYGYPLGAPFMSISESFYFMIVTCTTVGYGDYKPFSTLGRYLMVFVIFFTIVVVPIELGKLMGLLTNTLMLSSYTSTGDKRHVILCGEIRLSTLYTFCDSFFDRSDDKTQILILNRNPPSQELRFFLQHPKFKSKVFWLLGNPLDLDDLKKSSISTCVGVFVFVDKFSVTKKQSDLKNIMRVLSVIDQNSEVPIYIQTLSQDTITKLEKFNLDFPFSINQTKFFILGRNSSIPGFSTFVSNLVSPTTFKQTNKDPIWKKEYLRGALQNMYCVLIPNKLKGKSFREIVKTIYFETRNHMLVIGIVTESDGFNKNANDHEINNNEYHFEIQFNTKTKSVGEHTRLVIIAPSPQAIIQELRQWDDEINPKYIIEQNFRKQEKEIFDDSDDEGEDLFHSLNKNKNSNYQNSQSNYSNQMDKDQEKNQRKRNNFEKIVKDLYFTRNKKQNYENAIDPQNLTNMKNHVIITGCNNSSLYDLISPIRSRDFGNEIPIVILTQEMTDEEWEDLSYFTKVYVYFGNFENINDLQQIRIQYAKQIIFVNSPNNVTKLSTDIDMGELYVDSQIVFKVRSLRFSQINALIISEIIHPQNLRFFTNWNQKSRSQLSNKSKSKRKGNKNNEGDNDNDSDGKRQSKKRQSKKDQKKNPNDQSKSSNFLSFLKAPTEENIRSSYQLNPNFFSSSVFLPAIIETMFSLALTAPDVLHAAMKLIFGKLHPQKINKLNNINYHKYRTNHNFNNDDNESILFSIKMPANYFGLKKKKNSYTEYILWEQLLKQFLKKNNQMIPVAIYRNIDYLKTVIKNTKTNQEFDPKIDKIPFYAPNSYLITNPTAKTPIYPLDTIFILGTVNQKMQMKKLLKMNNLKKNSSIIDNDDSDNVENLNNDELMKNSNTNMKHSSSGSSSLSESISESIGEDLIDSDIELIKDKRGNERISRKQFKPLNIGMGDED
ncbi:calcium-activated potassium channel alpha chain [Anaeramoeba flamelloides]|uniref:Calcium-activated potassium channel alpha chain n=1 Tax=Anaeramoeba flamelloides TaxID=1746091 RepID=A0ABQ8YAV0_9EUKA|nr:calcium-activated potassium channel alpha chain [Anaeramoeba flamelloides]